MSEKEERIGRRISETWKMGQGLEKEGEPESGRAEKEEESRTKGRLKRADVREGNAKLS